MKKTKTQCNKCSGKMKRGIALKNIITGIPDFVGSSEVCTMSYGPDALIIPVLKCERCGRSVPIGVKD